MIGHRARERLRRAGAALAIGATAMLAWGQELPVPAYAPLVDQGAVLSAPDAADIVRQLQRVQAAQGTRIAVLTVPTTQPEDLQSYANRVGNAWKLGRRGVGDGVLVVVATQDRAARIEVARSLEGAIPDLEAKRILRESMSPRFAQGDFHGGLQAGIDRIAQRAAAEGLAPPVSAARPPGFAPAEWVALGLIFGGFGVFMAAVLLSAFRGATVTRSGRWIAVSLCVFAGGIADAATLEPLGVAGAGFAAGATTLALLGLIWRAARFFASLPVATSPSRRGRPRRGSAAASGDAGSDRDSSSSSDDSSSSSSSDSGGGGDFSGGGSSDSY